MRYFVIVGNTRVGSTWLQSALHALPGVFSTREIRWWMPYQEQTWPVHTYIDSTTRSMKERLDHGRNQSRRRDVVATGAKLKLDPYGYVPPAAFEALSRIVENDVQVIMARRPYFEIFETWKVFGIRHLANPAFQTRAARPDAPDGAERQRVDRFHAVHGRPPPIKKLVITRNGHPLTRFDGPADTGVETIRYPIEEAINDLFVLFYNDLSALRLIQGRANAELVDYAEIGARFFGIARHIVPDTTQAECRAILATPATAKIEPEGVQLVFPDAALRAVSEHLSGLFREVRDGRLGTAEILRYDEQRGCVEFATPELPAVLDGHPETTGLGFGRLRRPPGLLRRLFMRPASSQFWQARRPVYEPATPPPAGSPVVPT